MSLLKELTADRLAVRIYDTRAAMGQAAGADIAAAICTLQKQKSELNMIFAAAPSQNETLAALISHRDIDWTRINAYHMDEYIGLAADAPQRFGTFLKKAIFDRVPFRSVNYIDCTGGDPDAECARYAALLRGVKIDIVVLGIGENGHIAFNDPPVADFDDPAVIKPVALDEVCRRQQVNDGCFAHIDEVPKTALTLTVPTLFAADYLFCSVPAATKAEAVRRTVTDAEISTACPATIMRKHPRAVLYCDRDSGAKLLSDTAQSI